MHLQALEKVVFDMRNARDIDDGPDGVKISGTWEREVSFPSTPAATAQTTNNVDR